MIISIPTGLIIILCTDYLHRYTIDPVKIFIYAFTIGGFIFVMLDPSNVILTTLNSGETTLKASDVLRLWGIFLMLEITILFFYYTLLIYQNAVGEVKNKARLTVIGGIIFGLFTIVFYTFRLPSIIPGIMEISSTLGMLLVAFSFKREPRLVNVLIESYNKAKVKLIKNIIPICAHCKKIRDEDGKWTPLEQFFHETSKLDFSHGICPSCLTIHYSDLDLDN
jgi:hypothetical protein